tara:strand:+ start:1385 stop:1963 length:579 start_codon:yes stop_codon:yes gene_type:complete
MEPYKIAIIACLSLLIAGLGYLLYTRESFTSCEFDNINSEPMDDYATISEGDEAGAVPSCATDAPATTGEPSPLDPFSSSPKTLLDSEDDPVTGNSTPVECFPKGHLNPSDLLPSDKASEWSHANPVGKGSLDDQNFLSAGFHSGINTVGQSLRNANMQLRSEPANPQKKVGPWMQSTIEPDLNRKPLEIAA